MVELGELRLPVGAQLVRHAAAHEVQPIGGALACSCASSAAYSAGSASGTVDRNCATFISGPFSPPRMVRRSSACAARSVLCGTCARRRRAPRCRRPRPRRAPCGEFAEQVAAVSHEVNGDLALAELSPSLAGGGWGDGVCGRGGRSPAACRRARSEIAVRYATTRTPSSPIHASRTASAGASMCDAIHLDHQGRGRCRNLRYTTQAKPSDRIQPADLMPRRPCHSLRFAGVASRRIVRASVVATSSPSPQPPPARKRRLFPPFLPDPRLHRRLQLVDEPADHVQSPFPECRIGGVQAERRRNSLCRLVPPARSIARYFAWNPGCPDWTPGTAHSPGSPRTHRHRHRTASG